MQTGRSGWLAKEGETLRGIFTANAEVVVPLRGEQARAMRALFCLRQPRTEGGIQAD